MLCDGLPAPLDLALQPSPDTLRLLPQVGPWIGVLYIIDWTLPAVLLMGSCRGGCAVG